MHILLTNDDGIQAIGIQTLAKILAQAGHRISVCAPDQERSGASHSITLRTALTAKKQDFPYADVAYAVDGLPADCARLGLHLVPDADIVIAGINNGPNLGGACVYSGTVSAAMEASMKGTPALATSLAKFNYAEYESAARITLKVAEWMINHPLARGQFYNLNIPGLPYEEIRGIVAAKLAPNYLDSPDYILTEDGKYQYTHGVNVPYNDLNCDKLRIQDGFATLTKLTWDIRANADEPDVSEIQL